MAINYLRIFLAQSVRAEEYMGCISVEELNSPNECPVYDLKQSDGEAPVMRELWGMVHTGPEW